MSVNFNTENFDALKHYESTEVERRTWLHGWICEELVKLRREKRLYFHVYRTDVLFVLFILLHIKGKRVVRQDCQFQGSQLTAK